MFRSTQTKLLGVTSLLAVAMGAIYYALKGGVQKSGTFALFAAIPLLINFYTVHCVIFGNCTVYSWILTIILTLYAAGIFFIYGSLLVKRQQEAKRAEAAKEETASLVRLAEQSLGLTGIAGF